MPNHPNFDADARHAFKFYAERKLGYADVTFRDKPIADDSVPGFRLTGVCIGLKDHHCHILDEPFRHFQVGFAAGSGRASSICEKLAEISHEPMHENMDRLEKHIDAVLSDAMAETLRCAAEAILTERASS